MDSGVILMDFEMLFGRPRGFPGAPFSDLARPEAARAEKKWTKRGLRGIMDACGSFVGNPPWPEECFCDENIVLVNNKVLARGNYRQFGGKSASKRSPK